MIPVRLELRGFLTFRDPQVLDFSGVHSAVIIGPNGVGKSALFDAITFALFSGHRGGKSGAEHLLHQGANELAVRFDFEFSDRLYRVERTLTRRVGYKRERFVPHAQAFVWDGSQFKEIPETEGSDACKIWVENTLGMDFATCCASVLLRQNEHDQFLRARPAERQKILNALLDLESYHRLEQAARAAWQNIATEARTLDQQLMALPAHNADVIAQLLEQLADVVEHREGLEASWATARDRLMAAQTFSNLRQRLEDCNNRLSEYRSVVHVADQTIADAERHQRLNRIVPLVREALRAQELMEQAELDAATAAGDAAAIDLAALWDAHGTKRITATNAVTLLTAVEAHDTELRAELQAIRPLGEALTQADAARVEAANHRSHAADLDTEAAAVDSHAAEVARLRLLERDRPWLAQLRASRQEQADAVEQVQCLLEDITANEAGLLGLRAELGAADEALATARQKRREAEQAQAEARATLAQKRRELDQREQTRSEQTCSRCGAVIDHARIADEVAFLKSEVEQAAQQVQDATVGLEDANRQEHEAEKAQADIDSAGRQAETRLQSARSMATQLQRDIEREGRLIEQAASQLSFIASSATTASTVFPSADDLVTIDMELAKLPEAERAADQSREAANTRNRLLASAEERETAATNLELTIPAFRRPHLRARWATIHDDLQKAADDLAVARAAVESARRNEQEAWQAAEHAEQRKADLLRQESSCRIAAERHRDTRNRLLSSISTDEQLGQLTIELVTSLATELEALAGAPERLRALETARHEVARLEGEHNGLVNQIECIQEDARQPEANIQAEMDDISRSLAAARQRERESDLSLTRAREASEEARRLNDSLQSLRQREADLRLLESLLSREHLQGRLAEEARIGIAEAAQRELDAISNGTLTLDLHRTEDGENLELLITDHNAVHRPIEAVYLSGSQKFRVAVAMALGIGQYVTGAARGRRAVIIDEGFGSLDEEGIDSMAAHLRDLSDRLDRVLLVTHQTSMQQHFRSGFRIERRDGGAIVTAWAD